MTKKDIFLGTAVFELESESNLIITHEHSHVNTISPSATASKWCENKYMIDAILCYVHRICEEMHLNICKETCYIKKETFERKSFYPNCPREYLLHTNLSQLKI